MIARLQAYPERVFPITQTKFDHSEANDIPRSLDQQAAIKLLSLADRDFTRWERLCGWKLDLEGQMGHLLMQHRLAVEAELAAQWPRADFFWKQVKIGLQLFSKQADSWQLLASAISDPNASMMSDPQQLRQRLVEEWLIDTHCGFYNGLTHQAENLAWNDRAFVHIDYIQGLMSEADFAPQAIRVLLEQPWQIHINLCKQANQWRSAIQVADRRVKCLPTATDYQAELADLHYVATLSKLREAKLAPQYLQNAARLQDGIRALEKLLKTYPEHASIFEALGSLYHLRAVSLGNGKQVVQALVAAQRAVTYNPHLEQASETRKELIKVMESLQAQMDQIVAQMSQQGSSRLNAEGKYLKSQADRGFSPMHTYIESEAAKATAFAVPIARAIRLWRNIGLPEPPKGWPMQIAKGKKPDTDNWGELVETAQGWSKLALKLWAAVSFIWQDPPRSGLELQAVWASVVAGEPDLAGLDAQLICGFLEGKLFPDDREADPTPPMTTPPLLNPVSLKQKRRSEPLLLWLFSRQDRRIKLQAGVASVLLLAAGGLTLQEQQASAIRDTAYQNILAFNRRQDDVRVLQEAEKFFSHTPLSGRDARKQQVIDLYSESLVRWVAQQEGQPDTQLQAHLDRYRNVLNNVQSQEK